MPNRILRDWTDSLKLDGISADAERLFIRILMRADDFGRFHADPRLLRSGCFPLLETVRTEHIARWLDELSTRRLVFRYEVGGRAFLSVVNFRQRLKEGTSPRHPAPDGKDRKWVPDDGDLPGSAGTIPDLPARGVGVGVGVGGGECEGASPEPPGATAPPPKGGRARPDSRPGSLDQVREFWAAEGLRGDPAAWWDHFTANGWVVGKARAPMRDWRAACRTWSRNEGTYGGGGGGNGHRPRLTVGEAGRHEPKTPEEAAGLARIAEAYSRLAARGIDRPTDEEFAAEMEAAP